MISVEIANGEHIGVATEFKLPDLFDGVTTKDLYDVQRAVGKAEEEGKGIPIRHQSKELDRQCSRRAAQTSTPTSQETKQRPRQSQRNGSAQATSKSQR